MTACLIPIVISACSADGDPAGRVPVAGSDGLASVISVEATDFQFDPDLWRIVADGDTAFDMVNAGSVEHNWVLISPGSEVATAAEIEVLASSDILWEQPTIQSGESATGSFVAPSQGSYQVICSVPGHFDLGMKATLQTATQEG